MIGNQSQERLMRATPRRILGVLSATVLVVVLCFVVRTRTRTDVQAATRGAAGPPAVPVVAATAQKGDIGVYRTGLGAVTPLIPSLSIPAWMGN